MSPFLPWLGCWGLLQQPQTNTSWLLFEQQLHFHQALAESSKKKGILIPFGTKQTMFYNTYKQEVGKYAKI